MSKKKFLVMILALGTILAFGTVAMAGTYYVDDVNGTAGSDVAGTMAAPYKTLYDCITYESSLANGDTIYVDNGTYVATPEINITKELTIIGKQWEATDHASDLETTAELHFDGPASDNTEVMITIKANNVTIKVDDSSATSQCQSLDLVNDAGSDDYLYGIKVDTFDVQANTSVAVEDVVMADAPASGGIHAAGIYFHMTDEVDNYTLTGTIDNCDISRVDGGLGISLVNDETVAMTVNVKNCTLDGTAGQTYQTDGIKLTGAGADVLFTGTVIEKNIIINHDGIGIHLSKAAGVTVQYNSIGLDSAEASKPNVDGLEVDGDSADALAITYNYFNSTTLDVDWNGAADTATNSLCCNHFTGDVAGFANADTGVTLDVRYNYWGDDDATTLTNCDITPILKQADLTDTYVDDTWDSQVEMATGRLFGYDAFSTIQAGVNAIPAGTSTHYVTVAAGTYAETVTINKDKLTVRGAQYGVDPTVAGARTVTTAESTIDAVTSGFVIQKNTNGVTVDGFTVGTGGGSAYKGVWVEYNTVGATVRNNIINGATFSAGVLLAWDGTAPSRTLVVDGATVSSNLIKSVAGIGVDLMGCAKDCTVSDNTITNCTGRGICFTGGTAADKTQGNTISGNTITGSNDRGIWVKEGRTTPLGAYDGSVIYLDDNKIQGNTISGGGFHGIDIAADDAHPSILNVTNLEITGNTISGNANDGIKIQSWDATNTINGAINGANQIFGNAGGAPRAQYGIENTTTTTADARNNWWGHATGPYHGSKNPNGEGNAVSDYVDFIPFYTTPTGGSATADTWGVWRAGAWYLDITGDGDAGDTYETFDFGVPDGVPLVGDWNGDGTDTWGVFRNGVWYRDITGDGDAGDPGETFNFGNATDTPLVGDWNGDGTDTWGVFRDGAWFLDHNGDGTADEAFYFGNATDTPLVGDFNGDDTDTCGVFRDGAWFLDKNGDYDAADVGEAFYFGNATDTPLVGNWSGNDTDDTCGVWRAGAWFLDINGDNDAADTGEAFNFGLSTDTPLVGNWGSGAAAPTQAQAASAAGWYAMCFPNPASTGDAVTFRMMGAGVNAVQVSIYDLGGGLVYQSNFETGRSLTWDLYSEGAPVANGIYLYAVTAKAYGELISTEVGKLLILR